MFSSLFPLTQNCPSAHLRNFPIVPFVWHTLNDYYVKRPINNTPSERFEWVKCGKYWEQNPIIWRRLSWAGAKKKQLVLLWSGSIYFYGCHPFLCFLSPSSFIYENAKRSFVQSINSVVLLITILSWEEDWKQQPKESIKQLCFHSLER